MSGGAVPLTVARFSINVFVSTLLMLDRSRYYYKLSVQFLCASVRVYKVYLAKYRCAEGTNEVP